MTENALTPVNREIAEIENRIASDRSGYFADEAAQARYAELIQAREHSGEAIPDDSTRKELAAIERTIREDRAAYFRDTAMQERYAALLTRRTGQPAQSTALANKSEADSEAAAYWQSERGQKILAEWERNGGAQANAKAAVEASNEISALIPASTRFDFEAQVAMLPMHLQAAMVAELANPYVPRNVRATASEVALFASTPEGESLVEEWGERAARCVGVIRARAERIRGRLSNKERADFDYFLDHITADEFKAIARFIVRAA